MKIYLVTTIQKLFESDVYKIISVGESLSIMKEWRLLQFDTETSGTFARLDTLLCVQFGNEDKSIQIVVDISTIDIRMYKELLESRLVVGQNLKFDLQFLYNYKIIPMLVYDTMIVEQLLYLGYPSGQISYSLKEIAWRRLNVDLDKSIRGQIIWRGLDEEVIKYAANDVVYLYDIMKSQIEDLKKQGLLVASKVECDFEPVIAYLEWCGIHLDVKRWSEKMKKDKKNLEEATKKLNDFLVNTPSLRKFWHKDLQGDLFTGFNDEPIIDINWSSSQQVIKVAKILGFNTTVKDDLTDGEKDSVMEKHLKSQKGINDEFLKLYFNYQGYAKVVTSFGQGHLNTICPVTNRSHTIYKQLGTASGRMSCGSNQPNYSLAKVNRVNPKECTYPNYQQLPSDEETRACFTAPKGYKWCSCDYSALESRLGADIYNEKNMLEEFLTGSGDMHSLCAYMVYTNEIPRDTPIKEIKKLYPHLRKEVKGIEFSQQFGGSEYAIQNSMGCSIDKARAFKEAYERGFPGIAKFKTEGSKFVRSHGYVLMCKYTGHKMYWWDWKEWKKRQESFNSEFWEEYRLHHKDTGDYTEQMVKRHFKAASKWDRLALNSVTQGSGSVILKIAMTNFFRWIVNNNYFGLVELAALVHDESNIIYPEYITEAPIMQKKCMEEAAALICTKLPIPAEAEIGDCWLH